MEKSPALPPEKSGSFTCREEKKQPEPTRNLSMSALKNHGRTPLEREERPEKVVEEEEQIKEGEEKENGEEDDGGDDTPAAPDLGSASEEIDRFLESLSRLVDGQNQADGPVDRPGAPEASVGALLELVDREIAKYDVGEDRHVPASLSCQDQGEFSLLDAVDRASRLAAVLGAFPSDPGYRRVMDRASSVVQRAMAFLEEEFRLLLEDSRGGGADAGGKWTPSPQGSAHENERSPRTPGQEPNSACAEEDVPPAYPPEIVERLWRIAGSMLSAGYETECCQVFSIARRNAFEAGLSKLGFERISIEEVQKMPWESLESEVATWIKALRRSASVAFSRERDLCAAVFSASDRPDVAGALFTNLVRGVVIHLLNFAEAVAMTKRSAEKLFKFLDMYEALRDLLPQMDTLFPAEARDQEDDDDGGRDRSVPSPGAELKSEVCAARCRLGDASVGIFSDMEGSIRSDASRTPVPGGAVHPLTRYVMNYLKYACEYKNTLEEVFKEHQRAETASSSHDDVDEGGTPNSSGSSQGGCSGGGRQNHRDGGSVKHSPFAAQLVKLMGLLDANLGSKAKLYKDPALSSIFLMNNGRYIMQKIKGSAEIHSLLGDSWCRRRSSDLRQYHKNYQRETWGKVLGCFKDEGLQVKGSVSKPVLKERFKSFNAMLEEIHKTQSGWVVSDEQLQSELRVSVSAVVVPAYRSFLGRFQQYLDAGRQTEKYIKFGPEDLESYIDDLFDGNPNAAMKRRA
ncbi:hypothetical protein Taro_029960 [Colocasia esculenta]|uniref:Exocyst subunit Exo70 family protein n=1 Tax=Colocasia esculenta TaxID=4460 RepID=A0A843VYR2_COLES|nr:hypothetical protein [Colocasia esculenta]